MIHSIAFLLIKLPFDQPLISLLSFCQAWNRMVCAHQQVQFLPEISTSECRGARTDHERYTESGFPRK